MEERRRNDLLKIKEQIEKECDRRKLPLATLQEIMSVFDDLLMGKMSGQTIMEEVAKWYKKHFGDFIDSRLHISSGLYVICFKY